MWKRHKEGFPVPGEFAGSTKMEQMVKSQAAHYEDSAYFVWY